MEPFEEAVIVAQISQLHSDLKVFKTEVKEDLGEIKEQTKKTNGHVTELRMWRARVEGAKQAYGWVPAAAIAFASALLTFGLMHLS